METPLSPQISQLATQLYASITHVQTAHSSRGILHIDNDFTLLILGTDTDTPDAIWQFPIGIVKTPDEYFQRTPPSAGQVEEAIQVVEDVLMPKSKLVPAQTILYSSRKPLEEIVEHVVVTPSGNWDVLGRTDMEHLFGRLSAVIGGRPASVEGIPDSPSFVAALLILREVMFHLGFKEVHVLK